jgi:hypothetical protein
MLLGRIFGCIHEISPFWQTKIANVLFIESLFF